MRKSLARLGAVTIAIGAIIAFSPMTGHAAGETIQQRTAVSQPPAPFQRLACISPELISAVRRDLKNARDAFVACRGELNEKLQPMQLTESQQQLVFASVLAHSMAPYGSSISLRLADLLRDAEMDCDNYAILSGHIAAVFGRNTIAFAGFDGGAIGNHAQLLASDAAGDLLLDPTIGLVARVSFNELMQGKPVPASDVRVFRQHADKAMDGFALKVSQAIRTGKYLPSDLLYFFPSLDEYIAFSEEVFPLWSKPGYEELLRRYPTPGARALRKNLEAARAARKR